MFGVRLKFVLFRYLVSPRYLPVSQISYLLSPAPYLIRRLPTQAAMSSCGAVLLLVLLVSTACAAPARLSPRLSPRLGSLVTGETRGLEVPRELVAGIGAGSGAMQLVINVHTDSFGNIEVYTN